MSAKHRAIAWAKIFSALRAWQKTLPAAAVEQIAEKFARSPWAILVSTIISLRTKDEVTLPRSLALLEVAPSPRAYLRLTASAAEKLLFPAGFYRVKARQLRQIAERLLAQYRGEVPAARDALLTLPGVGRKTANLVLAVAFAQDAICVDTHVHRIANRLGWTQTADPAATEIALVKILPRRYWQTINADLVRYGQRVCRPLSPYCSRCVIRENCARENVAASR